MARTIEEIRLALGAVFVNQPTIQQVYTLTPGNSFDQEFSKVSIESLLFFTLATAIYTLEVLFDSHKTWIEQRALELKWGSLAWYVTISKSFQYGDQLVFQDDIYQYSQINEINQIVKLAAATELGNQILLKVAGEDSNGNTIALTTPELDALRSYIKQQKPPGIKVNTVSRDPDLLMIYYRVYVDALAFSADGSLITDSNTFPVEDAINTYIRNLPFNGVFSTTALTDLIQQSTGVINPVFESVQTRYGTNPYAAFTDYYTPNAGYLQVDTAYPLTTTVTYILQ